MKKGFALLLILALLLGSTGAMAAPYSHPVLDADAGYRYIPLLTGGGDSLYFIDATDNSPLLYHWQLGMEAPELWSDAILFNDYWASLEDALEETGKDYTHSACKLFMRGDALYAINTISGLVFEIAFENGSVAYKDVVTLDWTAYQALKDSGVDLYDAQIVGDTLYLVIESYNSMDGRYALEGFDLLTGKRTRIGVKNINEIAAYKDGLLIVSIYDQENAYDEKTETWSYPTLHILNPKDGTLQKLLDCDESYSGSLQYDAQTDTLYFMNTMGIMAMPGLSQPVQAAYATLGFFGASGFGTALLDGGLFAFQADGIFVSSTNPKELPTIFLKATYTNRGVMNAFSKQHPGVPVVYVDSPDEAAEIISAGLSKVGDIDIMRMGSRGPFAALIDKGFALDLSSSEIIKAEIAKMPPAVQEICMRDGKIFAVPVDAYSPALCLEEYYFRDTGLSMDDFPTNFIDWIKFISEWDETYADLYPDVLPYDMGFGLEYLFSSIQNEYVAYYEYLGEPLTFDTDLFRSLLAAWDARDFTYLENLGDEAYEKNALLTDYGNPMSGNYKRLGMRLTADTPYIAAMDMSFAYVNANSKNPDLAIAFLEGLHFDYDAETRIILYPGVTEAYEWPDFEQTTQRLQTDLDLLKTRLETAEPADVAGIKDQIANYEDLLNNPDRYRYEIRPDVVAQYREMVTDNLLVSTESILYVSEDSAIEVRTLKDRYLAGQIDSEGYLQQLERIAKRIQQERR
jgi:ABC-type sugar transport system, periplasmic component